MNECKNSKGEQQLICFNPVDLKSSLLWWWHIRKHDYSGWRGMVMFTESELQQEDTHLRLRWDLCDGADAVVVGEVVLVEQNPLRQIQFMSFCSITRQTVNLSHVFVQQHEVIPRTVHISGDLRHMRASENTFMTDTSKSSPNPIQMRLNWVLRKEKINLIKKLFGLSFCTNCTN